VRGVRLRDRRRGRTKGVECKVLEQRRTRILEYVERKAIQVLS
jgi:hypothetical protein